MYMCYGVIDDRPPAMETIQSSVYEHALMDTKLTYRMTVAQICPKNVVRLFGYF